MHAEVMAIGDELTSGQRLDTNSQWLSQQLGDLGIPVLFHTTVGDDLDALTDATRIALRRAPLVLVTGGLGPTADDLTRDAIALAVGRPLELHPAVLDEIREMFESRGRSMPAQNEVQAKFPTGAQVIPNPHGTAPGIDLAVADAASEITPAVISNTSKAPVANSRLFALPGVPAEMKEMFEQSVLPQIRAMLGISKVIVHRRVKCFGVGESHCEEMMPGLIDRDRVPRVGITVHQATITLRVTAEAENETACDQIIRPTVDLINDRLGKLVFGYEDEELEHAVLRLLRERSNTLAVCEWGTQGTVARWLSQAGCHATLKSAVVAGGHDNFAGLYGVEPQASAEQADLVSWMADQLQQKSKADFGLAIGPLPDLAQDNPRIHFGLATPAGVEVVDRAYAGHPNVRLERAAKQALDFLRHSLLER